MRNLLLCVVLTLGFQLGAANLDHLDHECYAQVGGKRIVFNGSEFYKVTIPTEVIDKISNVRKFNSKRTYTYKEIDELPWANREYFIDWLKFIDIELQNEMKAESGKEQLLFAWLLGVGEFKKVKFDIYQLSKSEDVLKLRLFQSLQKWKEQLSGEHPPPLPTDGRDPTPYRYGPPQNYD